MENSKVRILYRDDDLVAVYKPAGVKMHRSPGDSRRQAFMLQETRELTGRKVFPVHRLDQPTSGVLLFAFSSEVARLLAEQFRQQTIAKRYVAVARGIMEPAGTIDYPLVPNAYEPKSGQTPKPAVTDFKRLATAELPIALGRFPSCRYSLAAVYPRTGRMHQIRRHFHHISHPVVGDTAYGDGRHNRLFREQFGCHRLLLACVALALNHPRTGAPLHLTAPLDLSFQEVGEHLGWCFVSTEQTSAHPSEGKCRYSSWEKIENRS
ncbi:MAG: pseudouridylate synthase [Desulfatitalea sp.]|nr:pseudouridylate synthase [Desulfatitalea sp.]MBI5894675.1 pseudouridylate synthase [Desulfobacterales bacterium]